MRKSCLEQAVGSRAVNAVLRSHLARPAQSDGGGEHKQHEPHQLRPVRKSNLGEVSTVRWFGSGINSGNNQNRAAQGMRLSFEVDSIFKLENISALKRGFSNIPSMICKHMSKHQQKLLGCQSATCFEMNLRN